MSDKFQGGVVAGATSVSLTHVMRSAADSTEQTGKVAADMTLSYLRQGGVRVAVGATNLAAVNSVFSAGGVKEIDSANMPGLYRIDWPDAAFVAGADHVTLGIKIGTDFVSYERIPITSNVIQSGDSFAKTANLPPDPADASDITASFSAVMAAIPTANANADALLDRANGVETGLTLRQWLRLGGAALFGKVSGLPGSPKFRDHADSKDRISATTDTDGNRSAVTTDAT